MKREVEKISELGFLDIDSCDNISESSSDGYNDDDCLDDKSRYKNTDHVLNKTQCYLKPKESVITAKTTIIKIGKMPMLPDIIDYIHNVIYSKCECYQDFINWSRTCTRLYKPLSNNLYCNYLLNFITRCYNTNSIKNSILPHANHFNEMCVLEAMKLLCGAVTKTIERMKIHTSIDSKLKTFLYDKFEIGKICTLFPAFQNENEKACFPRFMGLFITYYQYIYTKYGFNIMIGDTDITRYNEYDINPQHMMYLYISKNTISIRKSGYNLGLKKQRL